MLPDDVFDRLTLDNKSALAAKLVGREVCLSTVFHFTAFHCLFIAVT